MAESATRPTDIDPRTFIAAVADPVRRRDAERLIALMAELTGETAVMWGPTMIGFGRYAYRYESGTSGETFRVGFAPRGRETVLYLLGSLQGQDDFLERLGPHRTGRSCLYIKDLDKVDMQVLREMIVGSYEGTASQAVG